MRTRRWLRRLGWSALGAVLSWGIALAITAASSGNSDASTGISQQRTRIARSTATMDGYGYMPRDLTLSVDGSLDASSLTWSSWTPQFAIAAGILSWRNLPSPRVERSIGVIYAYSPQFCDGTVYLTRLKAAAIGDEVSDPPVDLPDPCGQ